MMMEFLRFPTALFMFTVLCAFPGEGQAASNGQNSQMLPPGPKINAMLSRVLGERIPAQRTPALLVSDLHDDAVTVEVYLDQQRVGTATLRIERRFSQESPVDPSLERVESLDVEEVFGILEAPGGWECVWAHMVSTAVNVRGSSVATKAITIRDFGKDLDSMFDRARGLRRNGMSPGRPA